MTILDSENTIYDNKIEEYFHEYFTNRGLDLEGDGYKRIENNLFHAAFEYVYRKMFKPDEQTARRYKASRGEMMGKFDNGQSVVANNMQITQGISDAVYRGNQALLSVMQQELMATRQQNEYLQQLLQKETGISYKEVGKASQKFAREYSNRTGKPAFI